MNQYIQAIFIMLSLAMSSRLMAQPVFKLSGYAYEVMAEGTISDTVKREVKVYDKDSLLLFDTLWNGANAPALMMVTVYDQHGKRKSRYTKAGDKFEQNVLFLRDAEGRLIEQVFTGSDSFRLKTIYQFDQQGRVERTYLTSGPSREGFSKSMIRHYYNEKGQEVAQETYIGKKRSSRESKEYDERGRIIKNTSFESSSGEKTEEHFEYDTNGAVIRITLYTNDILDFIQENKWLGHLPESSEIHYHLTNHSVKHIFYLKEVIQ